MPPPVVLGHVAEGGVDPTLSGDGVGSGREELGDAGGLEARLGESERGPETGSTGATAGIKRFVRVRVHSYRRVGWRYVHDESVILVFDEGVLARDGGLRVGGAAASQSIALGSIRSFPVCSSRCSGARSAPALRACVGRPRPRVASRRGRGRSFRGGRADDHRGLWTASRGQAAAQGAYGDLLGLDGVRSDDALALCGHRERGGRRAQWCACAVLARQRAARTGQGLRQGRTLSRSPCNGQHRGVWRVGEGAGREAISTGTRRRAESTSAGESRNRPITHSPLSAPCPSRTIDSLGLSYIRSYVLEAVQAGLRPAPAAHFPLRV